MSNAFNLVLLLALSQFAYSVEVGRDPPKNLEGLFYEFNFLADMENNTVTDYIHPAFRLLINGELSPSGNSFVLKETWDQAFSKVNVNGELIYFYLVSEAKGVSAFEVVATNEQTNETITFRWADEILYSADGRVIQIRRITDPAKYNQFMGWIAPGNSTSD